ncbi:MAG: lytic transglycosylase protein [Flaviaesturariibacter sp.]|nr:lytic transglycosylase protein [Flaviaesturariibacter sp.]
MLNTNNQPVRSFKAALSAIIAFAVLYLCDQSAQAQVLGIRDTSYKSAAVFKNSSDPIEMFLAEPGAPKISLSQKSQRMVDQFVEQNEEALEKITKKSAPYFQTIEALFRKQGIPTQLKYLAVVESGLKTNAVSSCGAMGVWQLMPETARNYGLKINRHSDERKHFYKSTVAAAKYLGNLYAEFGDWLLVVAAYNGGSGSVHNAIKKCGSRNYYVMHRYLPAETKAHVEHFIATHYYFEGKGSVVTLTKAEAGKHVQKVSDYLSKRTCEVEQANELAALQVTGEKTVVAMKE